MKRQRAYQAEVIDIGPRIRGAGQAGDAILRRSIVIEDRRDPDDLDANRRTPRMISGARAVCPLAMMAKRGGLITDLHIKASRRLGELYEVGVLGAKDGPGAIRVQSGFGAGTYPSERQLDALQAYRGAVRVMGKIGTSIVMHVILGTGGRCDVAAWATPLRISHDIARGFLVLALDNLADHFYP